MHGATMERRVALLAIVYLRHKERSLAIHIESEMFVCILLARVAQSHKSELDRAAQNK
jgi:hypothetical protein